jgi:hypothetical protein
MYGYCSEASRAGAFSDFWLEAIATHHSDGHATLAIRDNAKRQNLARFSVKS